MDKPNILFVMADQFRHDYMGCAGAEWVRTPNLDRLAAMGVRFTQCITNAPVCAPARIGLAAGLQPGRMGAVDNAGFLPRSVTTYYQRLRDHGYRVGCVGKLDLAKPDGYNGRYGDRPCVYGWGFTHPEECEGKMHAGSSATPIGPYTSYLAAKGALTPFYEDYQYRRQNNFSLTCHDSVTTTEDFEDHYIGRRAAEWIRNIPDDFPWHYFVSFVGPHDPFDPPTEYADRYRDADMPSPVPVSGNERKRSGRKPQEYPAEKVTETRRQYCAAIELIDDAIGSMLDALEERGQLENTCIIWSSDHGEMLGDHGMYTKAVPYEASLRVPLIVAGPGIAGGRVSNALVELIDCNPTICEFAGLPPQERIDAISLGPVLRGEQDEHRPNTVGALRHFRCIRTDSYKLIDNYGADAELYDLREDPDEQHNILNDNPEIGRELNAALRQRYMEGKWCR